MLTLQPSGALGNGLSFRSPGNDPMSQEASQGPLVQMEELYPTYSTSSDHKLCDVAFPSWGGGNMTGEGMEEGGNRLVHVARNKDHIVSRTAVEVPAHRFAIFFACRHGLIRVMSTTFFAR